MDYYVIDGDNKLFFLCFLFLYVEIDCGKINICFDKVFVILMINFEKLLFFLFEIILKYLMML